MRLFVFLHRLESALALLTITWLIVSMSAQIGARFFALDFPTGIDALNRHLLLVLMLQGALIATRDRELLAMQFLTRFLPMSFKNLVQKSILLIALLATIWLTEIAYQFYQFENEAPIEIFQSLTTAHIALALPIAFAIMAARFFCALFSKDNTNHDQSDEATS